jgi:septum formation protein
MLILASRSTTRRTLLSAGGLRFETRDAGIDERAVEKAAETAGVDPATMAMQLASAKALAIDSNPDDIVIGADQLLVLGTERLHKPADLAAARAQLQHLRGKTHQLVSGVAIARVGGIVWSHSEAADLTMRGFSDAELDQVLALEGDAVLSSVGAYRLEGPSIRLFETISGDYFSILGLPLLPVLHALREYAPHVFEG